MRVANKLTMISLNVLCRLRPRISPSSFSNIQFTVARHVTQCSRALSRNQQTLYAVRRSSPVAHKVLNSHHALTQTHREMAAVVSKEVLSHHPFSRCLSTVPHSEDGNLIYSGSLGNIVRVVKLFSYTTSGVSLLLMPQILLKTGLGVQGFALQAAFCGFIGFFTFLTPVLLHVLTKGYVVRLYHNPDSDTYTAITYNVVLAEKKNVFHQSQVKIPAVSKMFTTFYGDKTGLLVNPDLFPIPHDYNHLMGYDKPFSFSTEEMDQPEQELKK